MKDKSPIYEAFKSHVEARIQSAQRALDEATESVHAETKGSAGDKHETGRAMAQLEVENTGKVLQEAQQLSAVLHMLLPQKKRDTCTVGALVETTQGTFYLSGGIGKLQVEGSEIFCIGMSSPLGQALLGKKTGDKYLVVNRVHSILSIT